MSMANRWCIICMSDIAPFFMILDDMQVQHDKARYCGFLFIYLIYMQSTLYCYILLYVYNLSIPFGIFILDES